MRIAAILRLDRCDECIGDRCFDIQTRERGAFLSAHAVGTANDASGRTLEIGLRGHDARILAAHLGDAGFRIATAR